MTEALLQLPPWLAFVAIAGVGILRGVGYYLSGRWLRSRADATGSRERLASPSVRRAEAAVSRFGAPAVTVAYFVVGLSAASIVAAGATRMRFGRFLAALATGALLWAGLMVGVGLTLLEALRGGDGEWVVLVVVGAVLAVVAGRGLARRTRAA